ncbi:MAG: prepilin-type N-terminal cleavage/methylation domain-containing protein [Pyrinomonadaceae bacterium]
MSNSSQKGFSLIELLIVVVIIAVVAALAVPAFQRGIVAAENRNVHATLKTMKSTQAMFFSQNQRFARLDELNQMQQGGFGTVAGDTLIRNGFVFEMTPANPTEQELRGGYSIGASRDALGMTWRFEMTPEGLYRVLPGPEDFD